MILFLLIQYFYLRYVNNVELIYLKYQKAVMKNQTGYDHLAKLLIIGDSGVGKTNILLRFCENNFMSSHLTTIGTAVFTQELTSKSKR